jgi:hypothetical protein
MPSYLVETYLSGSNPEERLDLERQARSAAEELARGDTRVRLEQTIHLPEDETCFFVFDAPSAREAALVAERAQLHPIRVVAVSSGEEQQ